jgi:peptide/nickel transport system substrate-binding protein
VLLPRDAQELDPRFVSDIYGHRLSRLIFASLMRIDPMTLEAVPDLAESVDVVSDTEYRVTLRPGLQFSDGSPLDSADVVSTFRSVVDPALHARYAPTYARIADVQALDATHVMFRLDGPHATFLTDLELPILRAEDAHRRIALAADPAPIGAGPYLLAKRQPGLIELVPNPRWYGGTPHVPDVRMLVVRDDNTRALRLRLTLASTPCHPAWSRSSPARRVSTSKARAASAPRTWGFIPRHRSSATCASGGRSPMRSIARC